MEKAEPTCEREKPFANCRSPILVSLLATGKQGCGQKGKPEAAWFGSPCAHQTSPSVILAEIRVSRATPSVDTDTHRAETSLGSTAMAPEKAKPAQQTLRAPDTVPQPAVALSSSFPRPGHGAPAGSGLLGKQGCRVTGGKALPAPLCLAAAWRCLPRTTPRGPSGECRC